MSVKPVRSFFALDRAVSVKTDHVERYIAERRASKKAPATINREIEGLKQAFNLAEPINDIAKFGYLSGWRRGEIVPLKWNAVDRVAREVRLRTSKNGDGRVLRKSTIGWPFRWKTYSEHT